MVSKRVLIFLVALTGILVGVRQLERAPLNEALLKAAAGGDLAAATKLLERGADVNTADPTHYRSCVMPTKPTRLTPLMLAVRRRSLPLVRLLLQHGANANAQDAGGETALMHSVPSRASRPGDEAAALPIAQALLAAGADANLQDDFGDTALMPAAQSGALEMTKLLLEHGADVRVKNRLRRTAWMIATEYQHVRLTQLLLSRDPRPEMRSTAGATALHTAARAGRASEVRRLIAEGIDVNAPDASGSTALMLAASRGNSPGNPDTVRPFKIEPYWGAEEIRLGRQAWLRDKKSHEDARAASRRMRRDTVLALLEPAARLRVEGEKHAGPLFRAALSDDRAAAHLLAGGADPNARDITGFTALMGATALGHR